VSENRKGKSVVFRLDDPFEAKLYEHAMKHKSFSPYILRLIQRDMEGGSVPPVKMVKEVPKDIKKDDLPI
jgi:hypothetical protein